MEMISFQLILLFYVPVKNKYTLKQHVKLVHEKKKGQYRSQSRNWLIPMFQIQTVQFNQCESGYGPSYKKFNFYIFLFFFFSLGSWLSNEGSNILIFYTFLEFGSGSSLSLCCGSGSWFLFDADPDPDFYLYGSVFGFRKWCGWILGTVQYLLVFQGEFACDQCGKVLKSKGSLDYHKRTHSGEYAYRSAFQYETFIIFVCYVRIGVKAEL